MTKIDHHGENHRGASFRGQDLEGAVFAEADLGGADFTNCILVEADFSNAQLGVRPLTRALLLVTASLVAVAAGVVTGYFAVAIRDNATSSEWQEILGGWLLISVIVAFFAALIVRGVVPALRVILIVMVAAVVVDFVIVYSAGKVRLGHALGLIGLTLLFGPAAMAEILGRVVGGTFGAWAIGTVAVLGDLAGGRTHGGLAAIVVSVLLMFISKRALKADERDRPLHRLAHRIVTHRATRFTDANVIRADFSGTNLTHSDMSHAALDGDLGTWQGSGHLRRCKLTDWRACHRSYSSSPAGYGTRRSNRPAATSTRGCC